MSETQPLTATVEASGGFAIIDSNRFRAALPNIPGTMVKPIISPPAFTVDIRALLDEVPPFFYIKIRANLYTVTFNGTWNVRGPSRDETFPVISRDSANLTQNLQSNTFTLTMTVNDVLSTDPQHPGAKNGDEYKVKVNYTLSNNIISNANYKVTFTRLKESNNTNANVNEVAVSTMLNETVLIPTLNINGQTLLYGIDIGNTIFTIKDQFQYYDGNVDIKKQNDTCEYFIDENQVKTTIFNKCCPKIVDVVKGEGDNLYNKLDILFQQFEEDINVPFTIFYANLFYYAMTKYILARLLYGKFNTKYLLQKYNKKFLKDLTNSRFCGALPVFTECVNGVCVFDYDRYFK